MVGNCPKSSTLDLSSFLGGGQTLEVIRKMSLALDITADELVFDKTERQPRIDDKELIRNWGKVENLPEEDKQTIKKIVSALLVEHSVELAVRRRLLFRNAC